RIFCASSTPSGMIQHDSIRARNASISFAESVAAAPPGNPRDGVALISWPVMLWRRGSRLSSSAAVLMGSNLGVGFGGGGVLTGGVSAGCFGGSGLGGSVFFGSFFFRASSASAAGSGSAFFSGGVGFGSTCLGGGGASAAAAISCFFSTTLGG